ncbi:MAG: hypothetical protein KDD69_19120 [Bdellovibrionales bacterium]|nr:hypothetical protein [Bdellovibrionales bacterium]
MKTLCWLVGFLMLAISPGRADEGAVEMPKSFQPYTSIAEFHYGGLYARFLSPDVRTEQDIALFRRSLQTTQKDFPIFEFHVYHFGEHHRLADLDVLTEVQKLRLLSLGGCNYDRTQLTVLKKLEKLQDLFISGQHWNAEELKALGSAESISGLRAQSLGVEDWSAFPSFPALEELDLGYSNFDDSGVAALKRQKKLARLHLYDTKLTDDGLMQLGQIETLRYLGLTSPDEGGTVSWEAIDRFKAAYPNCKLNLERPHTPHPPKPQAPQGGGGVA